MPRSIWTLLLITTAVLPFSPSLLIAQDPNEYAIVVTKPMGEMKDKIRRVVLYYVKGQAIWGINATNFGHDISLPVAQCEVWVETSKGSVRFGELDFSKNQQEFQKTPDPGVILRIELSSYRLNQQIRIDIEAEVNPN